MNCSDGAITFKSYFDKLEPIDENILNPLDLSDFAISQAYPLAEANHLLPTYRTLLEQVPLLISCSRQEQNQPRPTIAYLYNSFSYQSKGAISFDAFESFLNETAKAIAPRFSLHELLIQGKLDKVLHSIPLLLNHTHSSAPPPSPLTTQLPASAADPLALPELEKASFDSLKMKELAEIVQKRRERVEEKQQLTKENRDQILTKKLPLIIQLIEELERSPSYRFDNLNGPYLKFKELEPRIKVSERQFKLFIANKIKEKGICISPIVLHRKLSLAKALQATDTNTFLNTFESQKEKRISAPVKPSPLSPLSQNKESLILAIAELEESQLSVSRLKMVAASFNALTGLNVQKEEMSRFLKGMVRYHFPNCPHPPNVLLRKGLLANMLQSIAQD